MTIRSKYYSQQDTPNTVSADRSADERGFVGVVTQSTKPIIDYELQLIGDIQKNLADIVKRRQVPSGWLRGANRVSEYGDYSFDAPGDPGFTANAFHMAKKTAMVAGIPVTVEYTATTTAGDNLIQLDAPSTSGKRTDFVFLEVWLALVGATPRATGTITVASLPSDGDILTLNGNALTARNAAPGVDEFLIGGDVSTTAANIASAINNGANSFDGDFIAQQDPSSTDIVRLFAQTAGTAGNALTLVSSVPVVLVVSGGTLTGGAARPNKPADDKLYRHGNTLCASGVYLDDDIADPTLVYETAQRVQVQYRIRTTGASEAVDFKTQPDGFSNSAILAQGGEASPVAGYVFVPADGATSSGNTDAANFFADSGLWIAGDGSSSAASDLQTLDGFVYAIPICKVFRRNDAYDGGAGAGFSPTANTNGGVVSTHPGFANPVIGAIGAGESDRPDGAFPDAINENDVMDLRKHVSMTGYDLQAEMDWQMRSLLAGDMRTWAIDMVDKQELGNTSGDVSTRPLVCNEIGRTTALGGNDVTSGDTTRGVTVRNFDHVARRFADQPVIERMVFELLPQDRAVGAIAPGRTDPGKYVTKAAGTDWYEGDVITIDLATLNASRDGTWDPATESLATVLDNVADFMPSGSVITDVLSIYHDDGDYTSAVDQTVKVLEIYGLGTRKVEITLDENPTSATGGRNVAAYQMVGDVGSGDVGSPRRIFVELEITYPEGVGLTDTPDVTLTPEPNVYAFGPVVENNVAMRPADMEDPIAPSFRTGKREVALEYIASEDGAGTAIGTGTTESFVSRTATDVYFWRRIYGSASFPVTATEVESASSKTVSTANTEYGSSSRKLVLSAALGATQSEVEVTYFAQDPIPNYGAVGGGYQLSVYYRTNAPQTAGSRNGSLTSTGGIPATLIVEPLLLSKRLWSGTVGAGSSDDGSPHVNPLDQIAVNEGFTTFLGDWHIAGSAQIALDNYSTDTGLLSLPQFVEVDAPDTLEFGGAYAPSLDNEFRAFYPYGSTATYLPRAEAVDFYGAARHKVFMPMLCRATADSLLWRKDELLLLVVSRWAELDAQNNVVFTNANTSAVAVYRTKGRGILVGAE